MQNTNLKVVPAQEQSPEPVSDPIHDAPAEACAVPVQESHRFTFTGSGKEYFRIWIVNLCLSIATLGIYSAWAKVRRQQYFHRNTQLGGAVFDFHGDPKTILKGRALGVVLLATYHYAFGFSKIFGIAVVCLMLLALPWMMRSALRFRLRNTSYRGLRFDFSGSVLGAYQCYFPVMLLIFVPTAIVATDPALIKWFWLSFLLYLGWPVLHASIRRYQHSHLEYGASRAVYSASAGDFFAIYFFAALIGFFAVAIAGSLIALAVVSVGNKLPEKYAFWIPFVSMLVLMYFSYLVSGPYLQTRIFNLAWCGTRFPNLDIQSDLSAKAYIKLQTLNAIFTLLSLGLYRPFAVVRAYRYRLAHMSVHTVGAFDHLLSGERRRAGGAGGDGAADFLGFDLSW